MKSNRRDSPAVSKSKAADSQPGYSLLDSGDGEKLERFGPKTLIRPSSICIWKKRLPPEEWRKADARYNPRKGWEFKKDPFDTWRMSLFAVQLELRTQTNGQVGVFPEHACYLKRLSEFISDASLKADSRPRVLNLFGYTGLASAVCVKAGGEVWHVDLSRKAIGWASINFRLNGLDLNCLRPVCEDAVKFLEREVKRKSRYQIIIADPPSFSRVSKANYWKLEGILPALVDNCLELLAPTDAALILTCHHPGISAPMLFNLLEERFHDSAADLFHQELAISETTTPRVMPAGSMVGVFRA